ncbi:MAG: VWA domain-containing protein [Luteitalea sp.]|nr:VWA domain-containing protein [Luteitalea sp.]
MSQRQRAACFLPGYLPGSWSRTMRRSLLGPILAAVMGAVQAQPSAPPRQTPANDQSNPAPSTASESSAQQPSAAVFRTEINYVEVDVSVTDEKGNFVRSLTQGDFQIFEEKIPQKIATFTEVAIPVDRTETTLFDGKPLPSDTASNQQPLDGRIYVMVLDDVHTHALQSSLVKKAANEFIEKHLGANDIAAVVYTGGRTDAAQEFTSNKLLLEQSVNRFMGRKIRSATLERLDAYNRQRGTQLPDSSSNRAGKGIQDPLDFERAYNARTSMGSLENIAQYLNNVQGRRKAILFFSEGIDYDTLDVMGDIQRNASDVLYAMKDAIAAATQNNVAFYTIDPRGLGAMFGGESIEMTAPPEDPAYGIGTQSLASEARRSQDSLRTLAEETGGLAVVNTNDFATAYDRIVHANSHYYLLGYYPKYERRDGRFRRIEVRVKRPGVKVVARKGYLRPRGREEKPPETPAPTDTSAGVKELLRSPLPQPGLTLGVTAAPFKGTDEKADVAVTIQVPGQGLSFKEENGRAVNQIEVSLIAIDHEAKVQGGDRVLIDPKLRPETHQLVQLTGFRLVRKLELKPGRYQLRVAAREAQKGTLGSVFYDLEVPDYRKKKLAMSGILLTSRAAALTLTPALDDDIKEMLETPPTPVRTFVAGDTLTAYAELYDPLERAHNVAITTRVKSVDGREVFRATEQRASTELEGKGGGYGHKVEIPLVDVEPGKYVLQIDAVPTIGKETALRELSFDVVAPPEPPPSTAGGGQEAQEDSDAVAFANFAFGPLSNRTKPEQIVIRSQAEWEKLWESLPTGKPLPKVDFEQEMLVAVFLGRRSTGGYSVRVDSVRREGDGIIVAYREVAPASDAIRTQQLTTPFAVARVVKTDGAVRFEQVEANKASQ